MCPECGAPLVAFELYGIEIDYCMECGGVWLDRGELALIIQQAGANPGGLTEALYAEKASGQGKGRCPRCNIKLERVVIEGEHPLELDRCPRGHGLYFDEGELQRTAECLTGVDDREKKAVADFLADMFKDHLQKSGKGVCE